MKETPLFSEIIFFSEINQDSLLKFFDNFIVDKRDKSNILLQMEIKIKKNFLPKIYFIVTVRFFRATNLSKLYKKITFPQNFKMIRYNLLHLSHITE